jgi:hypothetical protein
MKYYGGKQINYSINKLYVLILIILEEKRKRVDRIVIVYAIIFSPILYSF